MRIIKSKAFKAHDGQEPCYFIHDLVRGSILYLKS